MQSESEANAIAWGLRDFHKSKYRVLLSSDRCDGVPPSEHPRDREIILTQGSCFDIGLEMYPSDAWTKSTEEFISSWRNQEQYLHFELRIKGEGRVAIPRETSSLQKLSDHSRIRLDKPLCQATERGFYIGTRTAIQVPPEYTNGSLYLALELSVKVPCSKVPSNFRQGMSSEEKEVRALLESGRYHPPRVPPVEVILPVRILDSLEVHCHSSNIDPWTSLACIELRNSHPSKDILIGHVDVHLGSSLRVEKSQGQRNSRDRDRKDLQGISESPSGDVLLLPCVSSLDKWYDITPVTSNNNTSSVTVLRGESATFVFRIFPKYTVNDPSSEQGHTGRSISGFPPPCLSGDFITPVEIRWRENSVMSSMSCSNKDLPEDSEASIPDNSFHEGKFLEEEYLATTASLWWGVERITGNEFSIEIDGPKSCRVLEPVALNLKVSNLTSEVRNVELYMNPAKETVVDREPYSLQKWQWITDGTIPHEIVFSLGRIAPGEAAVTTVHVYPLHAGLTSISDMHIHDEDTKELFTLKSSYSLLVYS